MNRKYTLVIVSLLVSLFVYLFYRTDKTIVNQLAIMVFSKHRFVGWRGCINALIPLHEVVVYSLPEGLWVFCIALTSRNFFIQIGAHRISLVFLPLIIVCIMEVFQLFQITNGRFDFWDLAFSAFFWAIANLQRSDQRPAQNIAGPFNSNAAVCVASYLIVYLAHVAN